MGKLHSKHGDSFVVNACLARKGLDDWIVKQKYYCTGSRVEQPDSNQKSTCGLSSRGPGEETCAEGVSDDHYRLEVALPPEKIDSCTAEERIPERESTAPTGPHKQLQFEELECAVSVEEDNRQEWTFTLYDFDNNGKVTREDITSLLHTIYEVVDASVNHSPSSSKNLRVKLSVGSDASHRWRSYTHTSADTPHPRLKGERCSEEPRSSEKKSRALLRRHHGDHHPQQGCTRHCVDENLERRNHYLDLAGIENYTSRFGTAVPVTEPPKPDHASQRPSNQMRSRSHEPENGHAHPGQHRRSHTITIEAPQDGPCPRSRAQDSARHTHGFRSPKGHRTSPAQGSCGRVMKRGAPPIPAPPLHAGPHQGPAPYRRHKQRPKEGPAARALGPSLSAGPVVEKEQVREMPGVVLYDGGLPQVVQRHEHHHHHEHHYHYHHFYQS
ncbi:protein naked cuticle homolog 1 [Brachyhypopomus gauderio]|uniref:protein naked cuticle homolog 1 n=1 Tax=Brachyhypopomus gauderio TaxID=698409 RepID=UPI00404128B6